VDKLGGGETVPLSYIEITIRNQGGSADMVPWGGPTPIQYVYKKQKNCHVLAPFLFGFSPSFVGDLVTDSPGLELYLLFFN
jgi:hypothetical protein